MSYSEPNLSMVDIPAMEAFPSLKPLLKFDGSEVVFYHNDGKYIISTIDDESPDNPTIRNITIGIWEMRNGKKIPAGFCDAWFNKLEDKVTLDIERHNEYKNLPKDFRNLDKVQYTDQEIEDEIPGADAFVIDKNYRRTGLSDVFQAQTLAIFQGLGAKEVYYVGDDTTHSDLEVGYIPQYKSDGNVSWEQSETSFYSKWSAVAKIKENDGSHYTKIKPVLSGMQISLLKQAGL